MENVNESAPYPQKYLAHYPKSKAIAEQEVLAATGSGLGTVSLRPHLIWGPGDHHLVPRILNRAHRLRRIGNRDVMIDSTYIDNAAQAHIQALDLLKSLFPVGRHMQLEHFWKQLTGLLEFNPSHP
jgi:nucleoside-diphosphate-sugar epimerase